MLAQSVRTKDKIKPKILGYIGTSLDKKKIEDILKKHKISENASDLIKRAKKNS